MTIVFRRVGFIGWRWVWCAIAHRPFYVQDKVHNWYCDACRASIFVKIAKEIHHGH